MEKVMYRITAPTATDRAAWSDRLRDGVAAGLTDAGAHAVFVNIVDEAVEPAAGLRIMSSTDPADAVISVWVDSAVDHLRRRFDDLISAEASTVAAYLVTESVPMRNSRVPGEAGVRTEGFAQLAFIRKPEAMTGVDFLDVWLNSHTQIAIDTQDTFLYVQNVVTRILTPGATPWDAIVEEGFPAEAMESPHAFFDAVGDDDRLARHQQEMFASVERFIDLTAIEVVPTSRYPMTPPVQP